MLFGIDGWYIGKEREGGAFFVEKSVEKSGAIGARGVEKSVRLLFGFCSAFVRVKKV